jgi:hypothetical protein
MTEKISSAESSEVQQTHTTRVQFDENVIIIEYNANESICKKPSLIDKLLKLVNRILKNS